MTLQQERCCTSVQEGVRQHAAAEHQKKAQGEHELSKRTAFRDQRRSCKAHTKAMLADFEAHVASMHFASQSKRHKMEAADLRVEMTLATKAAARRSLAQANVAKQVTSSIEAFEVNMATSRAGAAEGAAADVRDDGQQSNRLERYTVEKERMKFEAQVSNTDYYPDFPQQMPPRHL